MFVFNELFQNRLPVKNKKIFKIAWMECCLGNSWSLDTCDLSVAAYSDTSE